MTADGKQTPSPPSALKTALWFVLLSVPAAIAAYYRMFSGFAEWDDEGTLMMTVRQYLGGARLYEEIYSGYGPVYYFYNSLLRSVGGIALNHNAVRITSAALIIACSLLGAWMVLKLTRSLAAASVAHILVFRMLVFFRNEPGHPQELCMLLLLCLVASGMPSIPRMRQPALAAAGALAAALVLVKINIGIFAILAIALAVVVQTPRVRFWRFLKWVAAAGALLLPFVLMRAHLDDPAAQAYCFVITASIAGLLAAAAGLAGADPLSWRDCLAAAAGFVVTFGLVLLALVWQGVPMRATLNMLVLDHIRINVNQRFWYAAVELGRIWMVWALTGLCASIMVFRALLREDGSVYRILAPFQLVAGGAGLVISLFAPQLLLGFMTPFCWLLLCRGAAESPRQTHARVLFCTTTVLQTLYAYPIAGSQTYFLRVLLMLAGVILLFDGLTGLRRTAGLALATRRFARPAFAFTLAVCALAYPLFAYRAKQIYGLLTPLNMPGAERVHLEKNEAENYRWLVDHLRENCDTFVGLPGIPSLYFWTGRPSPGPVHRSPGTLNFDNWMYTFSSEQQQAIVDDLARHPNACAVYHPSGVDFWNRGKLDVRGWPLANYILTQFKTVGATGDYQFMIRNERQLELPASPSPPPRPPA